MSQKGPTSFRKQKTQVAAKKDSFYQAQQRHREPNPEVPSSLLCSWTGVQISVLCTSVFASIKSFSSSISLFLWKRVGSRWRLLHERQNTRPVVNTMDSPGGGSGREPTCQFKRKKRHGFSPWVRKIPWRRAWQPTPVYWPGESHGQRSLGWAIVHRVTQSWTWLKCLSTHAL